MVLVDDSIRRETQILEGPINMLKVSGIEKDDIHIRLGSPRNTKYCRCDTPPGYSDSDLLANRYPVDEDMAKFLGVGSIKFVPIDPYVKAITDGHDITSDELCIGCHTGDFGFLDI